MNIPISEFWSPHKLDIKTLLDRMLTGDLKGCIDKIKTRGSTFIRPSPLILQGWNSGSCIEYIIAYTEHNHVNIGPYMDIHTHTHTHIYIYIYIPMVNLQPYTYVYTCTDLHSHLPMFLHMYTYMELSLYTTKPIVTTTKTHQSLTKYQCSFRCSSNTIFSLIMSTNSIKRYFICF